MTQESPIKAALESAVLVAEPPAPDVKAAVFRQAGRIRFRQRLAAGVSALATVGVVSAVALSLANGGGGQGSEPLLMPAGDPPSATATPGSTPVPGLKDGAAILAALHSLVPQGITVTDKDSQDGYGHVLLTEPGGQTTLKVNVAANYPEPSLKPDFFHCDAQSEGPGVTCEQVTLSEGSLMVIRQGPTGDLPPAPGVVSWTVAVLLHGGLRVVVTEFNAVQVKAGPATRPEPVLTVKDLKALALDKVWLG
ncbi:hypothetical protein Rhe02_23200 [Rhizocola hellebori]|uniref:Uncharacterized protein n=1 Tax=Rhizocola hellebori TaxID=1392758 RepID=A0A8J3Q6N4_9ACTN|nr:hypothetical protein [Rhizocola hellebori]GIH04253.1 hypothetical protein Rhe02_23200 [Rhizocola hellebori]